MGQIEDEISQVIEFRYGTKSAFARKIGIPEQTLYSVLKNSLVGASMATVMPILIELEIDPAALIRGELAYVGEEAAVDVPLYGSISAGIPTEPTEANAVFPIPAKLAAKHPRAFMLRVDGTSMSNVMPDGSFALVEPCTTADVNGGIYAVIVGENAATVKRVKLLANGIALEPDSTDPTHHPIICDLADANAPMVSIIGRVVWFCPPINWSSRP